RGRGPRLSSKTRAWTLLDVDVKDLARRGGVRGASFDFDESGLLPDEPHHPLDPGSVRDAGKERLDDRLLVQRPDRRMDEETYARTAGLGLGLDQLVVGGNATEACGQHLLQHTDDVGVQERHPCARELLAALDRVQVRGPAQLLKRTVAVALRERGLIAERHVQQDHGGRWSQRGCEQRPRWEPRLGPGYIGLD